MFNRRWHAIVPAKRLKHAKSRLGREDLALPFITDVITALSHSELIESVNVVSADPTICELAHHLKCRVIAESKSDGLLPAIYLGIASLEPPDQRSILVVLGDLPCLSPDQVDAFLTQGSEYDSAFVSDAEGIGSTMWMRTHTTAPMPHFGPRSRAKHRESGAIEILDEQLIGARRDVDTAVNLWDAIRIGVGDATRNALDKNESGDIFNDDQDLLDDSEMIVTISQLSPLVGLDEKGQFHSLEDLDLAPLIQPRIGQRLILPPIRG